MMPLGLLLALLAATRAPCISSATVQVLWEDDFTPCLDPAPACANGLNLTNWGFDYGDGSDWLGQDDAGQAGWGNNELQCYVDDDSVARVEAKSDMSGGGQLVLQANKAVGRQCLNPLKNTTSEMDYTAPRLVTRSKRAFRWRGSTDKSDTLFIEARIKLPRGQGLWPAFWMLPQNKTLCGPGCGQYGDWCRSGEIDIVEAVNDMREAVGTLVSHSIEKGCTRDSSIKKRKGGWDRDFHTYALSWNATHMRWYIDTIKYHERRFDQWATSAPSLTAASPYDQPFYLILNIAVGGGWPKAPDQKTVFPNRMLVDWVRVSSIQCAASDTREASCSNGIDDDCDGLIDRQDRDCGACGARRALLSLLAAAAVVAAAAGLL